MRNKFDEQLDVLNLELIKMGALCEDAISTVIKALVDGEVQYLPEVDSMEKEIDRKEREIETLCMRLLLSQQPVAKDLRVVSSALKMISDMERIGDQACDIAEITKFVVNSDAKSRVHLRDMAHAVIRMVTDSVESFVKKDAAYAREVMKYDDVVDELFDEIKQELISLITQDNKNGEYCIDILMIAKYLERIGDHAVNIAEWVEYSITGIYKSEEIL